MDLVAQQHQKYVLIGNSYHEAEKERHAIEVLIRQRCNALIVHSKALSDDELAQFMDNIPGMVLINRVVPGYAHRCVCLDNLSGARMATRMLLNNGHQRIGYLSSSHGIEDDAMRKAGWMSALKSRILFRRKAGLALVRRTCRAVRRRWLNCWGAIYN